MAFSSKMLEWQVLADFGRRFVVVAFLATLLVPLVAISLSPNIRGTLGLLATGTYDPGRLKEVVKNATPVWKRAGIFYGTAMYRLGASSNPDNGIVGKDGFVFLGDSQHQSFSQTIHRQTLTDAQAEDWADVLNLQRQWLEKRGIPILFVVAPSPGTIYPDKLPDWAAADLQRPSSLDKILAAGAHKGIKLPLIDLRPALTAARAKADTYSRLNSHWTDFGAWVAWTRIAEDLASRVPQFRAFGVDSFKGVVLNPDGDNDYLRLLGIGVKNAWTTYALTTPFPAMEIEGENGRTVLSSGALSLPNTLPRRTRTAAAPTRKRVLVVRDSMGNALSPFLQATFAETDQMLITVTSDRSQSVMDEVERFKPDLVMYIMTERLLIFPLGDATLWRESLKR